MEVDQNNFAKALELVQLRLESCEFMSLHLLTNNRFEDRLDRTFYRDHNDFYGDCLRALKDYPYDFQPMEIALVTWRKDEEGDTSFYSFNFPIFPNPSTLLPLRKRSKYFTLDEKNVSSLLKRDFKFNTWIKDSVSHLTIFESDIAKAKLNENQNESNELKVEGEDATFLEEMTKKMTEFLENKEQTVLRFPACNAYKRRLIYQTFKAEPYSKTTFLQADKQQRDIVIVNKLSETEVKRRMEEYFNKQVGFLAIFKLIINSQKPIVGFNLFNDLLIYYKTFWTFPPQSLDEFKEIFRSLFPHIIDIQNMANGHFDNDCVESLFLKLDTKYKELEIAKRLTSDSTAFKIGTTFIKLMSHFYKLDNPGEKFDLSKSKELIERFKNKVYVPNNYDLRLIDLSNSEEMPNRNQLRVLRVLAEEQFLDIEDYLKEKDCVIVHSLNDDEFLIKLDNLELVLGEEQKDWFECLTVEEYFDELREIEKEEEAARRKEIEEAEKEEKEEQSKIAVKPAWKPKIFAIQELKLPREDDLEDGEVRSIDSDFDTGIPDKEIDKDDVGQDSVISEIADSQASSLETGEIITETLSQSSQISVIVHTDKMDEESVAKASDLKRSLSSNHSNDEDKGNEQPETAIDDDTPNGKKAKKPKIDDGLFEENSDWNV